MREQLTQFADGSALGNFVGMLTDSRGFLRTPGMNISVVYFANLSGKRSNAVKRQKMLNYSATLQKISATTMPSTILVFD